MRINFRPDLIGPIAALFLVACGDDPDVHRDAGPDAHLLDAAVSALCPVTLTYRETSAVPTVHVAGDWNAFSMTADRLTDDGSGNYAVQLSLTPGVHAYKLYVEGDGATDPWRFDPGNPYRTYFGTPAEENSGLRVPDCHVPGLTVVDVPHGDLGFHATLRYDARSSATPGTVRGELRSEGNTVRRPLTAAELQLAADGTVSVAIDWMGLARGKYTVEVAPLDAAGNVGDDVLLPFWQGFYRGDLHDAVVYMVMTDRYRNGDPSNDGSAPDAAPGAGWAGGDYQGITQSIDDGTFDTLGVNTLWISPFNTNPNTTYLDADGTHRVSGYHGYWPTQPREVDARFGGADALHALIAHAHDHGIRILMDLVVNHVHEDHPYFHAHPEWFNTGCVCGTSGCDWTAHRLDCLFQPYLPDINWSVPAANEQFIADALWWMEDFDLDGFRVDAVKHVADSAVTNLGTRVRERFQTTDVPVFLMGETAMGWDPSAGPDAGGNVENYGTIRRYLGPHGLTGQFDFPLYYAAALSFTSDTPGRGLAHVEFWTAASQREYGADAVMTAYIGSHDTSRFLTLTSDPARSGNKWTDLPTAPTSDEAYDRMYVALAWLLSSPGAPLLYYGDEYGEFGGADPDNRHVWRPRAMLSPREQRQLDRVAALVHGRTMLGLGRDDRQTLMVTDDLWAFTTGNGLVVLNRGATATTLDLPTPTELASRGPFTDLLDPALATFDVTHATLSLPMAGRSARYLHADFETP